MAATNVSSLIEALVAAGKAYEKNELGAREALIDNSRALATSLEIPSEFLQRSFWAEVRMTPISASRGSGRQKHSMLRSDFFLRITASTVCYNTNRG